MIGLTNFHKIYVKKRDYRKNLKFSCMEIVDLEIYLLLYQNSHVRKLISAFIAKLILECEKFTKNQ